MRCHRRGRGKALINVAETRSFTEDGLVVNTLAYLARHLVVLLDPDDVVSGLRDGYDRPEFLAASCAVFHAGPSVAATSRAC